MSKEDVVSYRLVTPGLPKLHHLLTVRFDDHFLKPTVNNSKASRQASSWMAKESETDTYLLHRLGTKLIPFMVSRHHASPRTALKPIQYLPSQIHNWFWPIPAQELSTSQHSHLPQLYLGLECPRLLATNLLSSWILLVGSWNLVSSTLVWNVQWFTPMTTHCTDCILPSLQFWVSW